MVITQMELGNHNIAENKHTCVLRLWIKPACSSFCAEQIIITVMDWIRKELKIRNDNRHNGCSITKASSVCFLPLPSFPLSPPLFRQYLSVREWKYLWVWRHADGHSVALPRVRSRVLLCAIQYLCIISYADIHMSTFSEKKTWCMIFQIGNSLH